MSLNTESTQSSLTPPPFTLLHPHHTGTNMSLLLEDIDAIMTGVTNMNSPTTIMERVGRNAVERMALPHSNQVCFRASSIGKPWILQVLGRWYPSEPVFSVSTCMKMLDGIVAQAWAEEILSLGGYEFEAERELRLQMSGVEVVGHSDIVVRNKATRQIVVLECKSMAAHIFSKFDREPHDEMGYISQLAFYTNMVRREEPTYNVTPSFLLYDRSMGRFKVCPITEYIIGQKFARVEAAIEGVASIPMFDLEALLDTVMIPPPMGGVPPSMKWSKWAKCFYYENVNREVMMYDKKTMVQLLSNMTQNKLGAL